jgi:DNA sulfur modification protein DndE
MKRIACVLVFIALFSTAFSQNDIASYIKKAPFKMPEVVVPKFQEKTFCIADFGGVNDGKTLNTQAFAKAIDACTKAGGGKVIVPSGNWLTGPIELKSNVDLHLEKGANILFTKDHTQYPIIKAGSTSTSLVPASPIYAYDAKNIAITGFGMIDGAGESWRPVKKDKTTTLQWNQLLATQGSVVSKDGKIWWPSVEAMNGEDYLKSFGDKKPTAEELVKARDYSRPYMVFLVKCENILIQGVAIRNSPKFIFYPSRCTNLTIDGAAFYNDWWAQNGDAIDISACKNVVIYNTFVNAGDDGICMKSSGGKGDGSFELENILIAKCKVMRAHGGFVIGSNTDGGMRNIYVTDCEFNGSDIGIRIKSNPGRGGVVKDIFIENITMKNIVHEAILFSSYYEDVPAGKTATGGQVTNDKVPQYSDFHLNNIECDGAETAISIIGLPDMPVKKLYFENITIKAKKGFVASDAEDIDLKNVKLDAAKPLYKTTRSKNIVVDGKPVE